VALAEKGRREIYGICSAGNAYVIDGNGCIECGRCADLCPEDAIEEAKGM